MNSAMKFVGILVPFDDSFAQVIDNFEENAAVFEVCHQVIYINVFNTLGIDPIFKDSDFSGLVSLWFSRDFDDWLFWKNEAVAVIKYLGEQNGVQSWVSAQNIFGLDRGLNSVLIAHFDDWSWFLLSSLFPISLVPVVADILQDMAITLSITQIFSQICYFLITAIFCNMIVDPSNKDFLISEFLHNVVFFIGTFQ